MHLTRLRVLILLVLSVTSSSLIVWHFASAIPAPSRNSTCEPGNCTTVPCTYDVFIDGSSYLARNCKTGVGDFKETTAQAILTDVSVNNVHTYFEPGTYSFTAAPADFMNLLNVEWIGVPGATIFQQANSVNVAKALIRLTGTSTNDILIQGITFDFNRANNPGSPGYTCPNAGWILQIDPDTGQSVPGESSNNIRVINNDFKNAFCQAIEWIATDGTISGNYFTGNHEALFLTGIQTQRVSVASNTIIASTDSSGANLGGIDLEDRVQNITITGNVLTGKAASGYGIAFEPANMTTVTGNDICCFQVGVVVAGPGAVGSVFNTITANVITNNAFDGVKVNHSSEQGTVITDNTLRDNGGGSTDQTQVFVTSSGPDILVGFNSMIDTRSGGARTAFGVYVISTNQVDVVGNVIDGFRSQGIRIENSNNVNVETNVVISSGVTSLLVTGTSNNGVYANNNLKLAAAASLNTQTGNVYYSNLGLNPFGIVTNFIENTGNTANPISAGATPTSATTYTVRMMDMQLIIIGGTVTAIVVNGKTIATVATTEVLELRIGDTFSVTFSVAPTWQASFR